MNIRKAFVLSVGGIVGAGSIMFVAAKDLKIDLSNAIQHIATVVISTGENRATLSSDTAGNLKVDTNNFIIGGKENTINESANGSAIMGGSGNVISGGNNNAILTGENNQISGTNQVIGGGKNNKITDGQNSVIAGGESNTVSAMNSVIIGNNSKVNGAYNITIGQNNNVQGQNNVVMGSGGQTSAQSGFLWAGGKGQGVSGAFVVYANSGMAVNTNTVAGFAKVSIGAPLIVSTGDTASIACSSEYVGTLKLVKKYGNDERSEFKNQMCLCSCNASGWTSLGGNKQCDVPCKNESEFYNPSTNDVDGICGSGLLLQNGTYTGNACLSGYKLIMDSFVLKGERKDNKAVLYWSCQKDEGKTKSCSQNLDNYKCVKNDSYKVFSGDMGLIPVHAHWNNNILPNKSVSVQYTGNKSALCSFSCNDGYTWVNDNGYDCKKQCTGFDGRKVAHGGTLTGYSSANPICNTECKANTFKCVDGNWQLDGKIIDLKYYYATCQTQTGHIVMPGERNRDDDAECTTSQNQGTETTMDQGSEMVDDEMRVDTRVDVAPSASEQSASSMGVYPGASSTAQNNINPLAGESSAGLAPIGMDPLPIGNGLGPVQPTYSQYTAGVCNLKASNARIHKVFSGGAKPSDITTSYLSETCRQYNANGMSCETGVVQELYVCKTGHHWEGNKCVKDTCPATTLKGTGIYSVSTGDVCAPKPLIAVMQWSGSKNGINYVCQATPTCTSAGWNLNEKCQEIKNNCPSPLWTWGSDSAKCVNDSEFAGSSSFGKPKGNIGDFSYKCLKTYLWVLNLPTTCDGVCEGNKVWNGSSCVCEGNKVWKGSSCECPSNMVWKGSSCECPSNMVWDDAVQECIIDDRDPKCGILDRNKNMKDQTLFCLEGIYDNDVKLEGNLIKRSCKKGAKKQTCTLDCDSIKGSTLHNAYCAKQYKRECPCDNEGEGNGQVCRELNENECKDKASDEQLCRAFSPHGSFVFNYGKEPCYYCVQKLGRLNNWYDECSSRGEGLELDCNITEHLYQKQYADCNKADICGTGDYSHCILDDSQLEENEKNCEAICVDEGGRLMDESLCNAYTRPQCENPIPRVKTPQCGDNKYECTVGSPTNKNSTATSFSWDCTNGYEIVSCEIGISCSSESSGGEDAGHCIKNEQDNLTFNGGSSCPANFTCQCNKSKYGKLEGTEWVCNNECCYNQVQSSLRACEYSENRQDCEFDGLCRWVVDLSSMIDVSVPKFEYCYKEESGSQKQTTTNSGHSRCGGLACGSANSSDFDIEVGGRIDVCTGIPIPSNSYCFDNGDKCEEEASKTYGSSNIGYLCQNYGYDTRGRGCYCYR